ncbi:LMBR1-domain-containing protein [Piromyces finnis]|uniref:LMBR1-domain-containing protein n=1 Tax=Piromyces finnis TaxID=1754191 RepID=A0A1Y1VDX3_9FUNG|nr:LMBR1-domain-containing protein [Piromyces finnis]|eukprot:ORX53806.1 LMBR1-domain-containing protein [Piromyces finnis]
MAYTLLIVGLCLVFAMVISIVNYYGNRKTSPWYLRLSVIIGLFFPFSIVLVLPLDITSSIYRDLTDEEKLNTNPPIGYQSEEFFIVFWNITYWISYALTWLFFPLISGYILSGYFTPIKKFKDSIYQNILFYGISGGIGIIFVIYIAVSRQMTRKALLGFLMAMSNAWGLLLCIVFMGYGLVDVPRRLWRKSDLSWINNYYLFKAQAYKESTLEASENLQNVKKDIFKISNEISSQNPLRIYADKLIELCPISQNIDNNGFYNDDLNSPFDNANITLKHLATLNYELKKALLINNRCQEQYDELVKKAIRVQDIVEFKDNPNRIIEASFISTSNSRIFNFNIKAWWWYFKLRRYLYVFCSIILAFLSISIIWSEVTYPVAEANISLISFYLKYSKYISYIFFELVIIILLLYMSVCTYTSLFRLQLFKYYCLFPNHHTDDNSLIFCASYLCRLIYPLCYNFLNLTNNSQSAFSKIMGKIDLVPLLGKEFNGYVPILMIVFTLITFFNIHGKVLKHFGVDKHFGIDHFSIEDEDDITDIQDGRLLIDQARRRIERQNVHYTLYSSTDYRNPLSSRDISNTNRVAINNYSYSNNNNTSFTSNSNRKQSNNFPQSESPSNNQNSAFDYPFHFKSQNTAYAAPSSTEFNQRIGSYTSNSNSTLYSPSVGGGHYNQDTQQPYAHSTASHSTHNKKKKDKKSIFSKDPFLKHTSTSSTNDKPKKKFGFSINTNPQIFYNPYPPVDSSKNTSNTPTSSASHFSNYSQGHSSNVASPSSTNSSRKFGHHLTSGHLTTPTFTTPSTGVKSKKRMFGVNYKLNG